MARPEKEAIVKEVAEILQNAKSVFVTDFEGLNVEQMNQFRRKCRDASVEYRVIKNTLARLAAQKVGRDEMVEYFQGPSAIAYSFDDPSAPARIITEFAKKAEKPAIKMSIYEGHFYGPEKVKQIASLPSKDVLIGQVVATLNCPINNFVGSLRALIQKFVLTLDSVREAKEKS